MSDHSPLDYALGKVRVLKRRCDTCIFWTDGRSAVSPERARDVIAQNQRAGALLSCHSTLYDESIKPAVCNGYWDAHHNDVPAGVWAERAIGIVRVDPPPKDWP